MLSSGRGGKNYTGSEEKFVFVTMMDPNCGRQSGEERQLCTLRLLNYINGTLLTDCTARKTDINIFEEDMHGANGDMTGSLVSVLYQCFTKTVPLVSQEELSVSSQDLTVTLHFGSKLSLEEKYLMKSMPYKSPLVNVEGKTMS